MISIYKTENTRITPEGVYISTDLRGNSTEQKPTEISGKNVDNGSTFLETDTGKLFVYDLENQQWNEV